ncbi:MAG: hypothetical protein JHC93_05785 [Parachlamydiales bacterium]|nr:hypothetical protein [Parachlamydiales bacterium]
MEGTPNLLYPDLHYTYSTPSAPPVYQVNSSIPVYQKLSTPSSNSTAKTIEIGKDWHDNHSIRVPDVKFYQKKRIGHIIGGVGLAGGFIGGGSLIIAGVTGSFVFGAIGVVGAICLVAGIYFLAKRYNQDPAILIEKRNFACNKPFDVFLGHNRRESVVHPVKSLFAYMTPFEIRYKLQSALVECSLCDFFNLGYETIVQEFSGKSKYKLFDDQEKMYLEQWVLDNKMQQQQTARQIFDFYQSDITILKDKANSKLSNLILDYNNRRKEVQLDYEVQPAVLLNKMNKAACLIGAELNANSDSNYYVKKQIDRALYSAKASGELAITNVKQAKKAALYSLDEQEREEEKQIKTELSNDLENRKYYFKQSIRPFEFNYEFCMKELFNNINSSNIPRNLVN